MSCFALTAAYASMNVPCLAHVHVLTPGVSSRPVQQANSQAKDHCTWKRLGGWGKCTAAAPRQQGDLQAWCTIKSQLLGSASGRHRRVRQGGFKVLLQSSTGLTGAARLDWCSSARPERLLRAWCCLWRCWRCASGSSAVVAGQSCTEWASVVADGTGQTAAPTQV